jgi:Na+/proline symporter
MGLLGTSLIVVGIVIFLVGFWFTGRSQGEEQCNPPIKSSNKAGGIAGIVIGLIFMLVGLVVNLSEANSEEFVQYTTVE